MNIERPTDSVSYPRTRTISLTVTVDSETELEDITYGLARAYNNASSNVDRFFLEIGNELGIPESDILHG